MYYYDIILRILMDLSIKNDYIHDSITHLYSHDIQYDSVLVIGITDTNE
jgi:hypothetical protein